MKKVILAVAALLSAASFAYARDVYVNGYYRNDGTYVAPHHRSAPDGNPYNNWSHRGNVNPYTGERGYRNDGFNSGYRTGTPRTYDNPYSQPRHHEQYQGFRY